MLSRLHAALSLLLIVTRIDAAPYDFNFLDNYRRPAPSPEDGPPASRNASRNKGLLPAQICAIVGAYVFTVLIWGVLLLVAGRKMRRKTQANHKNLELELVTNRYSGATPVSPQSARSATSWFRRGFKTRSGIDSALGSPESPALQSPASFDQKVVESDRDRAQAEMERLYAAVMEHDRKKSDAQIATEETQVDGGRRAVDKRLPRLDTSQQGTNHSNPASPMRAIYPPGYHNGATSSQPSRERQRDQQPPASPRSILTKKSSFGSEAGSPHKTRFNLKNLRISSPMKYPSDAGASDDEARTPLSPRFYNPGAPPSPPTQQNSPNTPGYLEDVYEHLDEVQPLPRPAPQRKSSYPPPASAPSKSPAKPGSSSSNAANPLPLRGYAEPLKSPDLRTTVLDRRLDKNALGSPMTGVPYTPYSPYMPFTPLTPVTPHLVTKKERKNLKKMEDRRVRAREELVQSPKEIFGDAY